MPLASGTRLGPYEIIALIGEGGMGQVYRARDVRLQRTVAIKLVAEGLTDERVRASFVNEARAAAALQHAAICVIHEVGEAEGRPYIVMELVEGQALASALPAGGFPPETTLCYGIEIADALAHAHQRGILHCDLKSVNVILTPDGRLKVLDFGLARRILPEGLDELTCSHEALASSGVVAGTLPYMAPELLGGQRADARSDLWALGIMLYEMATGVRPFHGRTGFELSSAILQQAPAPLPDQLPAGLRAILLRLLAKDPARRYQRAGELKAALEAVQSDLTGGTRRGEKVGGRRGATRRIRSLAVLPLENLSRDPEQEYFADGMTEALITDLAQIDALRVISRTSAMRFKGTRASLPTIAQELNVDGIVEGSVLRSGDRVRITAQLIHAASDTHLWARSYERDLRDVLALQSEVARAIADEIKIRVTRLERVRLARSAPVDPGAHEAYLRGRYAWNNFTATSIRQAILHFEEAIERDPAYAPAHAWLANSYGVVGTNGHAAPNDVFPKAKAAALTAVSLDETLADAHIAVGATAFFYDWDWTAAERSWVRAMELNPGHPTAKQLYAYWLQTGGRPDDAIAVMEAARALDPLSLLLNADLAFAFYLAGRQDAGIEEFRNAIRMEPAFPPSHGMLAFAVADRGDPEAALAEFQTAYRLDSSVTRLAGVGFGHAVCGHQDEARAVLNELLARSSEHYVPPPSIAMIHVALGATGPALEWLERAYEARAGWLFEQSTFNVALAFRPLRSDPQFQYLLRRMKLPALPLGVPS